MGLHCEHCADRYRFVSKYADRGKMYKLKSFNFNFNFADFVQQKVQIEVE